MRRVSRSSTGVEGLVKAKASSVSEATPLAVAVPSKIAEWSRPLASGTYSPTRRIRGDPW